MRKISSVTKDLRVSNVTEQTVQAQDQITINKEPKDDLFMRQQENNSPNRRFTRIDDTDDYFQSKNREYEEEPK